MTESEAVKLDERIGRLEETVAKGFFESGQRFDKLEARVEKGFREHGLRLDRLEGRMGHLEGRMDQLEGRMGRLEGRMDQLEGRMGRLEERMGALEAKFDIFADTMLDSVKTVLERIDGLGRQMERSTRAIRRRHAADRRLTRLVLAEHNIRILAIESTRRLE